MADDAAVLLVASRQVAGYVDEGDDRDAEGVAEADEPRGLDRGVDVDRAREHLGLVADDAHHVSAQPAQAHDDVLREERLHLEELAAIEHSRHDLAHVVRLVGRLGHHGLQLHVGTLEVVRRRHERRPLRVGQRQIGQKLAHARGAFLLGLRQEVRDAGCRVVDLAAAKLVERHGLARDHLDHLGASDEHVALAGDDEDEVGDGR